MWRAISDLPQRAPRSFRLGAHCRPVTASALHRRRRGPFVRPVAGEAPTRSFHCSQPSLQSFPPLAPRTNPSGWPVRPSAERVGDHGAEPLGRVRRLGAAVGQRSAERAGTGARPTLAHDDLAAVVTAEHRGDADGVVRRQPAVAGVDDHRIGHRSAAQQVADRFGRRLGAAAGRCARRPG